MRGEKEEINNAISILKRKNMIFYIINAVVFDSLFGAILGDIMHG